MDMVPRSYWENYPINVDLDLAGKVVSLLTKAGFQDVEEDPSFDWRDDTITPARWMFPDGTPPATVVSLNARYNPVFHIKVGRALRKLRKEGIILCGTGGAVHNLYRNNWIPVLARGDNFQRGRVPAKWAVEFEKSVSDVVANNKVRATTASRVCKGGD
jgi:aromatic ring-opening dioxygenase catalytic subunit (LigB family)